MFPYEHLLLLLFFLPLISFVYTQSTIYVRIVDDNDYPQGILTVLLPNLTFCNATRLQLQIQWINTSTSLADLLLNGFDFDDQRKHVYLTRTSKLSSRLIQDFCRTYHIPFLTIHSSERLSAMYAFSSLSFIHSMIFSSSSVMPDSLRVLISYLKYHHVQKAAYIYDNEESSDRVYQLLKFMNYDEYFNNFSLDIRMTKHQDIYSLLYSIEIQTITKDQ